MRILILRSIKGYEEKLIAEALKKRDIEFEEYDTRENYYLIKKKFFKDQFEKYDIILNREKSQYRGLGLLTVLNNLSDIPTVNTAIVGSKCWDKLVTTTLLEANDIPTLYTAVANDIKQGLKAIEGSFKYPGVIKTSIGSHGKGIHKVTDENSALNVFELLSDHGHFFNKEFYIQEYIEKPDRDIRCFIVGNDIVAAIYRIGNGYWKTNAAQGATGQVCNVDKDLEEITKRTIKAIGEGIITIDIFEDKERGYLVNEVNWVPEFKLTHQTSKVDIPNRIVDYLLEKAK